MVFDTQVRKIYHALLMPARFLIDTFDFVRNTRTHHGKIAFEECMLLKDYLSDSQGKLGYRICSALD